MIDLRSREGTAGVKEAAEQAIFGAGKEAQRQNLKYLQRLTRDWRGCGKSRKSISPASWSRRGM